MFLSITGNGDMLKGSGSSSIFYTMLATLMIMFIYYIGMKNMSVKKPIQSAYIGAKKLFPIAMILLLLLAIGDVTVELKTG